MKLRDPQYSGWFVKFRKGGAVDLGNGSFHVPPCTDGLCSDSYHSQDQAPSPPDCGADHKCDCGGVPCGEYLLDHRNESLREWIVQEHILGREGMGNENISGYCKT